MTNIYKAPQEFRKLLTKEKMHKSLQSTSKNNQIFDRLQLSVKHLQYFPKLFINIH